MAILITTFIFATFLWFYLRNRNSALIYWPVFGMLPSLLKNVHRLHNFLTDVLQQTDGTYLFKGPWFSGFDYLVTSDPMIVHYTMSKNFVNFQKGDEYKQIFEALGDGIFNVDGEIWKVQRKQIHSLLRHPSFEISAMKTMEEKIVNGLFLILNYVSESGSEIDFQDMFQRFTFDSICTLVLSYDPKSLSIEFPEVPFEKAFDDIEEVIFYRHVVPMNVWKLQKWLQIGEEKKIQRAIENFDQFVETCIVRKKEQLAAEEETEKFDLLTYFLVENNGENDANNVTKSNKFLRDMAFNLLMAGRDTVGAGLVWLIWLVATHPHVEKKILHEIKENLGENKWRLFSFKELNKLVYLHAVVCETLRLYPPVPFELKEPIESDILPGFHNIPKNLKILYSLYSMGRMEEIWGKDCLKFKPERWISETGKVKHEPSYKFIAFNAGPRTCLGKEFGINEMKLVASAIFWNYSIKVVENHPISPSLSLILYMKNGLKVRVSKRSSLEKGM